MESSAQSESTPPSAHKALLIVFLVVFIDLLGFGIVLPLLPVYADGILKTLLGSSDTPTSGLIIGLLMSSFSAMQFIFAPIWGRISDRIGRRPVLLIGLAGSVVFYALLGYASDMGSGSATLALVLLFAARIGAGVSGATISTAQAVIADRTPPEKRKHGMALIGAAFGMGFTFGPLIGAAGLYYFPDHLGITGYAAAGLSLIALILGICILPETREFGSEPPMKRRWLDWGAMRDVLKTPALAPVILTFFLATLGFAGFESTLALLNKDAMHLPKQENFKIFAYVGFMLLISQGFIYRRFAKKLDEVTLMTIGILLMGVGVVSLGIVSQQSTTFVTADLARDALMPWLLTILAICVIGFSFLQPSAQALISRRSDDARQGEILGVNQSASALARILGPMIGLSLYKLTETHLLPYFFGGGLVLLMLPLIPRIRRGGETS